MAQLLSIVTNGPSVTLMVNAAINDDMHIAFKASDFPEVNQIEGKGVYIYVRAGNCGSRLMNIKSLTKTDGDVHLHLVGTSPPPIQPPADFRK